MDIDEKKFLKLKELLQDNVAIGLKCKDVIDKDENLWFGDQYFRILRVQSFAKDELHNTIFCAIFYVNRIDLDSQIVLKVPNGYEGIFIGKGAWQVSEWCRQMGVRGINVVGV